MEHSQRARRQLERLASLGTTLAGAAHELNNPLAAIIGFAQLLRTRPLAPEDLAAVETILREAERTARIVRDLLQAVREQDSAERRAVDVNDVVGYVAGLRRYALETTGIACTLALDPLLPRVVGERAQLEQVVLNLLLNAEQALQVVAERDPSRAAIAVRTWREGDDVVLEVSDNGPGIADADVARIWEPFFTTRPESGAGLGLSVVHGIIASHGGRIAVRQAKGGGASFVLQLPSAPEQLSEASATEEARRALDVLVVDADDRLREFVGEWLTARGHAVLTVERADQATALMQRLSFDTIIADAATIAPAGEFLQRVRALAGQSRTRVVLAATQDDPHLRDTAPGAVPRLAKPYDLDELRRLIEQR